MHKPLQIHENFSLKAYNTFAIDAKAKFFTNITSAEQLRALLKDKQWQDQKQLFLGEGSNILLTQDYGGLVVKIAIPGIEVIKETKQHVWLKVNAGENWHDFVMYCIQRQYAGIENLSLIPGTVGAAPMQNIGAYGVELKSVLTEVETVNTANAEFKHFNNNECQFGYRNSIFKSILRGQYVIIATTLRLNKTPTFNVEYAALKNQLAAMQIKQLSIKAISDAVIQIRQSKLPDPKKIPNAGSFFKNPSVNKSVYTQLLQQYPNLPHFQNEDGSIKIPAAWLIEQCGWKGERKGDAGVHKQQALVLVNYGKAKGAAIRDLAKSIQNDVYKTFNIELQPEVTIINSLN